MRESEIQIINAIKEFQELQREFKTFREELDKKKQLAMEQPEVNLEELDKQYLKQFNSELQKQGKASQNVNKLLEKLLEEAPLVRCALGQCTSVFLNDKVLEEYLAYLDSCCSPKEGLFYNNSPVDRLLFRILLEKYLKTEESALKQEYYNKIQVKIREVQSARSKPNGQGLLPNIVNRELIRDIYLSENKELVELFEILPIPDIELFEGYPVPDNIQKRTEAVTRATLKILRILKQEKRFDFTSEAAITRITSKQRSYRAKRRQREEIARIAEHPSAPIKEAEKKKVR